jgi:hypothetical protein
MQIPQCIQLSKSVVICAYYYTHIGTYSITHMDWYDAKGDAAARLRQRKHALLQRLQIPPNALPGSLALTHRRCGQPNCHCAQDKGHPLWSLTFMVEGKKHVEWIPEEWVEQIRPLVQQGRDFKDALSQIFVANAQLLALRRRQTIPRRRKKKR